MQKDTGKMKKKRHSLLYETSLTQMYLMKVIQVKMKGFLIIELAAITLSMLGKFFLIDIL
jgi:hypothetical protein